MVAIFTRSSGAQREKRGSTASRGFRGKRGKIARTRGEPTLSKNRTGIPPVRECPGEARRDQLYRASTCGYTRVGCFETGLRRKLWDKSMMWPREGKILGNGKRGMLLDRKLDGHIQRRTYLKKLGGGLIGKGEGTFLEAGTERGKDRGGGPSYRETERRGGGVGMGLWAPKANVKKGKKQGR